MQEQASAELAKKALAWNLNSSAVFCIETIFDWLCSYGFIKGEFYAYRLNKPGTVGAQNWSLLVPLALEDLLTHASSAKIKKMITASQR